MFGLFNRKGKQVKLLRDIYDSPFYTGRYDEEDDEDPPEPFKKKVKLLLVTKPIHRFLKWANVPVMGYTGAPGMPGLRGEKGDKGDKGTPGRNLTPSQVLGYLRRNPDAMRALAQAMKPYLKENKK